MQIAESSESLLRAVACRAAPRVYATSTRAAHESSDLQERPEADVLGLFVKQNETATLPYRNTFGGAVSWTEIAAAGARFEF
jgi:hypothetical protein